MSTHDLTVLIVNYNTAHLLDEMFAALYKATTAISLQVIVVDNASADDSVSRMKSFYPNVDLIENSDNIGFGRANNQALFKVSGRYLLLLNTDTFVAPDTIVKTIAYMDAHPQSGVLGVRLVTREGQLQPCCRYFPTPWNIFLSQTGLQRFFPSSQMMDDTGWDHSTIRHCDWVPGCYYLIRHEVIDQVGLFDPRYFLYSEEVDHCRRVKQAGWLVTFFPDTEAVHIGGESAKSSGELTSSGRQNDAMQIESELLYFRKNNGFAIVLLDVLLSNAADFLIAMKYLLKERRPFDSAHNLKRIGRVWTIFAHTRWGVRPTR